MTDTDTPEEATALHPRTSAAPTLRPARRKLAAKAVAVSGAAVALIGVAAGLLTTVPRGVEGLGAPRPASPAAMSTNPASAPLTSGGMWPQSSLDEVRAAQARADAGDPAVTWQVESLVTPKDPFVHVDLVLVDRFIHEVLGWDSYVFNSRTSGFATSEDAEGWPDGTLPDQRYLRCAPGRTNLLYPPQLDSEERGESCAPTIDDRTYESVSLELAQLDRQGRHGIWVVTGWRSIEPFVQADPAVMEAQARDHLTAFLAARVAGQGAGRLVQVLDRVDVPFLYATTAGAPFERYEIERLSGPQWPDGAMNFSARLFADGGATVIAQDISWHPDYGLWMQATATTENGQPVVLSYASPDGEVTASATSTWTGGIPGKSAQPGGAGVSDVWFGMLGRASDPGNGHSLESIGLVDPVAYDAWCAAHGGSPLLTGPTDAAAIAQKVIADPDFETTAPVAAHIGGRDALSIDVALAPGGKVCGVGITDIPRWVHELGWDRPVRLRLYLVDLPEGMSVQTLAITVMAPEDRFEEVIAETAPIIQSIEFHPRIGG